MNQKVFFKTFGCRTNLFDTQVMKQNLETFECVEDEKEADIIVVNSCTVTNGADSGVRSYVNRVHAHGKKVFFTGCGVKTQGKNLFDKNLTFGVFDHSSKESINDFLQSKEKFYYYDEKTNDTHLDSTVISEFSGKSRAFLKIQEGCDFTCSYCVIPFVRGRARSMNKDKILEQVRALRDSGISEIVLTGTNVGSYGKEEGSNIAKLIKAISNIDGIKRIRIGSLEPSQIGDEFLEILESNFLEKHLHIALQHTNNSILKIMNRINRFESDFLLLEKIAKKGFAIGTDYIIGHPGESQDIWEKAFINAKILPLTHIHPFVYSVRNDTPSALMSERINGDVSKKRLHQLNALIKAKNFSFRQELKSKNKPLNILIESFQNGLYQGLDEYFNKVKIHSNSPITSKWFSTKNYSVQDEVNVVEI